MTDRQYNNAMKGVIFTNDRRTTDSHPHYQGQCEIDAVTYWLSGWVQTPKNGGDDFISLALKPKDEPKDVPRLAKDDPNRRGALFINDRKDTPEKPDYTGRCQVNDTQYWINAFIKAPREPGDDFISLQFEKATPGANRSTGRLDARAMLAQVKGRVKSSTTRDDYDPLPPSKSQDFDDDIPF